MKDKIAFCVCTHNRKSKLKKTLFSIKSLNNLNKFDIEIILISNDKLNYKKIINFFKKDFKIIFFREKLPGVATSRNKILELLRSKNFKYAAFIDDDCVFSNNWLFSMFFLLKKKKADIITGPQISKSNNIFLKLMERHHSHESSINWASTNNVFLKTSAIRNKFIFSNELNKIGGEDQLFFSILNKIGKKIFWNSDAPVYELRNKDRENLKWFVKRNLRYGASSVIIYKSLYGSIIGFLALIVKLINDLSKMIFFFTKSLFFSKNCFYLTIMYKMRIIGLFIGLVGFQLKEY